VRGRGGRGEEIMIPSPPLPALWTGQMFTSMTFSFLLSVCLLLLFLLVSLSYDLVCCLIYFHLVFCLSCSWSPPLLPFPVRAGKPLQTNSSGLSIHTLSSRTLALSRSRALWLSGSLALWLSLPFSLPLSLPLYPSPSPPVVVQQTM